MGPTLAALAPGLVPTAPHLQEREWRACAAATDAVRADVAALALARQLFAALCAAALALLSLSVGLVWHAYRRVLRPLVASDGGGATDGPVPAMGCFLAVQ